MGALAATLTEFSDSGNSRTYVTANHTALKPQLVIQKRKVPTGAQVVAEDTLAVIFATTDAAGAVLPQRVTMTISVRRPITGNATDVSNALVLLRDIAQSTELTNVVNGQVHLK